MKIGKNTSILSIATVLCVVTSVPLYAASSVRALGGADTYSSASSAAGAKASGADNAVRAGSLRVGGTSGGTRASSTRGASAPRLSIGKYLGGASVINGGSSLRPGQSGSTSGGTVSGDNGKLQERVDALEQFVGFSETGNSLKLDVESLRADLDAITGKATEVLYKDGFLTIIQDGETVTDVELATAADLQAAIDSIVIPSLDGYATLADIDAKGFLTSADLVDAQNAIDALRAADIAMDAAIKSLQGGALTADDLDKKVAELTGVDKQLQSAIDELRGKIPTDGSFASVAYVDGLVAELTAADVNLQSAISAIERPDVNKKYVDEAVDALNGSITALQNADSNLKSLIDAVDAKFANVATKDELSTLQEKIDGITAGNIDLTNYYTKAEAEGLFAVKTDLNDLQDSVGVNSGLIAANAADIKELQDAGYITDAALAPYAKSADLATVATTGSYDSLVDKPTIPSSVSELAGADVLVDQEDLLTLRTELEGEIAKKQQAGDYITADALRTVSDELAALKDDSYTKAEIDKKIAEAVTNGQVNLDAYATTAALTEMETALTALIDKKVNADALGDLAYMNMSDLEINAAQITSIDGSVIQQGTITADQIKSIDGSVIQQGTITAEKINTGNVPSGEMAMLVVGADGSHNWVSVTIDK